MKPKDLILRCYIEQQGTVWVAACIDLCLGAQDYTPEAAMQKLHEQIVDHVQDAFSNAQFTEQLLSRKAPFSLICKYHWIKAKFTISQAFRVSATKSEKVFNESMPLRLA